MTFDFSGKKILVTGAGRGIGRGIALALAQAAGTVYALDCNHDNLQTLAAESPNIVTIEQDLRNWDETRAALEAIEEPLDGLVNNAGICKGVKPVFDISKDDMAEYLDVNLYAVINCTQVIGKKMVAAGKKGSIVNISCISAHITKPGFLETSVSKAAVDMVTKQFAVDLGPHNIRVNSVNPALVDTGLTADAVAASGHRFTERAPIARLLTVEDTVGPVLYLLSEHAAMVTGTTHIVDGGISCNITTKN